ncbi:DUF1871 family protein [Rhodanobacter sp. FDAARGOS 1247]|uniref:DUF1871 family protein n=1 Tax=Rhodanobacter sp. FDAARGOS 1247 TaxID=2778082 RepID=UPI0034E07614
MATGERSKAYRRTRQNYDSALLVVASVVRSWDPCSLIGSGAPPDEFDAEIATVVAHIPCISDAASAAAALSSVFSASFESSLFSPARCAAPADGETGLPADSAIRKPCFQGSAREQG